MKELLRAVQYFHSKDIVHLNLNLNSILVLRRDPEHFLNDIDFGLHESEQYVDNISGDSARIDTPPNQKIYSREENQSNILIKGFCQANGFTKKYKYTERVSGIMMQKPFNSQKAEKQQANDDIDVGRTPTAH